MTVSTEDMRTGMRKQWAGEAYAILWEVAPATGVIRGQARYADAVIMSLWPSRGLHLHGVEIKVHRADWLREAKDPTKAERIAAYCDFWWIHVAPGVIFDLSEVPLSWGVREFDGKKWKTLREATKLDAQPCDRGFLASLLRRSSESTAALAHSMIDGQLKAERDKIAQAIEDGIKRHTEHQGKALEAIQRFKETSGIDLLTDEELFGGEADARHIGAVVRAVRKLGVGNVNHHLTYTLNQIGATARSLNRVAVEASSLLVEHMPELDAELRAAGEIEAARRAAEIENRKRGRR